MNDAVVCLPVVAHSFVDLNAHLGGHFEASSISNQVWGLDECFGSFYMQCQYRSIVSVDQCFEHGPFEVLRHAAYRVLVPAQRLPVFSLEKLYGLALANPEAASYLPDVKGPKGWKSIGRKFLFT